MEQPWSDAAWLLGPGAPIRQLLGLWRPRGEVASLLYRPLTAFILASHAFMPVCVALKLYFDTPQELEQITLCSLVTSICVGFLMKAALFVGQGETLRQTVRLLADIRAQFGDRRQNQRTRQRYQQLSVSVYRRYQMVAVPAVIGWVLCPLLSHSVREVRGGREVVRRQLPVPAWLPVDVYASPVYEVLYVAHSFCALVSAESSACIDMFFIHMMLMVAAELEVLNENLADMGHLNLNVSGIERKTFPSAYESNDDGSTVPDSDRSTVQQTTIENAAHEISYQQLVKNVRHHQAILRFVALLESGMEISIFSLLFFNTANLCSSLFVASVLLLRDGNVGKAMNALFTFPARMYETAMYCIYGHIMTDQSELLITSAFSSDWVNCDSRFKRGLSIFMSASVHPIVITVGKMCKISKDLLLQVLNGTYALLNMLYYLQSGK